MIGIRFLRLVLNVVAGGLGLNIVINHQSDFQPLPLAYCSRWAFYHGPNKKFKLKHLLDACNTTEQEALGWDRKRWNKELDDLVDFVPNPRTTQFHDKGKARETRLTLVMQNHRGFVSEYQRVDPRLPQNQILRSNLDRDRNCIPPIWSTRQPSTVNWFPETVTLLYAVWQKKKSWDVYIMERQFIMTAFAVQHPHNWIEPIHYEGNILSRPRETDIHQLKNMNNDDILQGRFQRSQQWDKFVMQNCVCIAPPKPQFDC